MKGDQPPSLAHRFFRWYCRPEFLEDLEGDLLERFERHLEQYGRQRANFLFIQDVLELLTPALMQNPFHLFYHKLSDMKRMQWLRLGMVPVGLLALGVFYRQMDSEKSVSFSKTEPSRMEQALWVQKENITWSASSVSYKDWQEFVSFMDKDASFSRAYVRSMWPTDWERLSLAQKRSEAPVLGVSWEQANAYLQWKSLLVTYQHSYVKPGNYQAMIRANKDAKTIISLRLPTEEEYEQRLSQTKADTMDSVGFRYVRSVQSVI